jgi:hypothetical protein|tara:strand:- start:2426 stop:3103 length:678 start_codon:yes stop_codon:yes gene_type:complete
MKLSENTISVLKSFSIINQGIEFKPGSTIQTISPQKSIMAKAEIDDELPSNGCFYELNRFLGVLTLFDDPSLNFDQKFVTVRDAKRSVNYTFADPQMIVTPPEKEIQLPAIDVAVKIKWEDLSNTMKAASVMGLPEIAISSDGSVINLEAISSKNPTADNYSNVIDNNASGNVFSAIFKIENMKVMNFDYDVELSAKGIAKFKSANDTGPKLTYWIATEGHSTFD